MDWKEISLDGKALFDAAQLLGVGDISTPLPAGVMYPGENPF